MRKFYMENGLLVKNQDCSNFDDDDNDDDDYDDNCASNRCRLLVTSVSAITAVFLARF